MLRALPGLARSGTRAAGCRARGLAQEASAPAVQDILVPDEGLVVLDGCAPRMPAALAAVSAPLLRLLAGRYGPGRRYDAKGFSAGSVRVEGAAMCTGGLLTQWRGVASLADVTEDSLALLYTVKPAPGVRLAWSTVAFCL